MSLCTAATPCAFVALQRAQLLSGVHGRIRTRAYKSRLATAQTKEPADPPVSRLAMFCWWSCPKERWRA